MQLIQRNRVVTKNFPKSRDDFATQPCPVQEGACPPVYPRHCGPRAGRHVSEEAREDELLQPEPQGRDVRWNQPIRPVARWADEDCSTGIWLRCAGIRYVPCRFSGADDEGVRVWFDDVREM